MAAATLTRRERSEARRREQLQKMRTRAGSRYRIHYDIEGPRVRLGMLWFVVVSVGFAGGRWGVALVFSVVAGAAASHTVRCWRARGAPVDPRVALVLAAAVVAAAPFGAPVMGAAILAAAAALVAVAAAELGDSQSPVQALARASIPLQAVVPTAFAGGAMVLLADLELWSAVSLVLLCSAYECGDYLIGSGSSNAFEGPLAGGAAVLVMGMVVAVAGLLPVEVAQAFFFVILAVPATMAGQFLGTMMLPHARALAPALRRFDSYLVVAPVWWIGLSELAR